MIKNILVATDFSETSEAAVVYARQLAHAFGSTLHVLHVAGNVMATAVGAEGYTVDFPGLQREVEESAQKQLDALITEEDRRTLSAKAIVLTSNSPAQAVVSYAKDAHVDLIVVGTHGRGGVPRMLIGSVAERVVRTAPCPVLTVRQAVAESALPEVEQVAAHAR